MIPPSACRSCRLASRELLRLPHFQLSACVSVVDAVSSEPRSEETASRRQDFPAEDMIDYGFLYKARSLIYLKLSTLMGKSEPVRRTVPPRLSKHLRQQGFLRGGGISGVDARWLAVNLHHLAC